MDNDDAFYACLDVVTDALTAEDIDTAEFRHAAFCGQCETAAAVIRLAESYAAKRSAALTKMIDRMKAIRARVTV
jgi:hypothetical protein